MIKWRSKNLPKNIPDGEYVLCFYNRINDCYSTKVYECENNECENNEILDLYTGGHMDFVGWTPVNYPVRVS